MSDEQETVDFIPVDEPVVIEVPQPDPVLASETNIEQDILAGIKACADLTGTPHNVAVGRVGPLIETIGLYPAVSTLVVDVPVAEAYAPRLAPEQAVHDLVTRFILVRARFNAEQSSG